VSSWLSDVSGTCVFFLTTGKKYERTNAATIKYNHWKENRNVSIEEALTSMHLYTHINSKMLKDRELRETAVFYDALQR
jgi:hypothetical protein